MRFFIRKKLFVDPKVQGALMVRCAVYWLLFAVTVVQIALSVEIAKGPNGPFFSHFDMGKLWHDHWAVFVAGAIMLPVVLLDTVFISNRIVGPLVRVRSTVRRLAAGEIVEPLEFRKKDYFRAMAADLNTLAARMRRLEEQNRAAAKVNVEGHDEPAVTV